MSLDNSTKSESRVNFKVVIVGERGAGKTSLALRYVKGVFNKGYAVTVGVEFYSKNLSHGEEHYCLQLWDTAGQQSFKSLVKSFYNHASCIILTYSSPAQKAKSLRGYLDQAHQHAAEEASVFVVRTKTDLQEMGEQERSFLDEMAARGEIAGWMDVCAKDGSNVDLFFGMVAQNLTGKFKDCLAFRQVVEPKKLKGSICLTTHSVLQSTGAKKGKKRSCCQ